MSLFSSLFNTAVFQSVSLKKMRSRLIKHSWIRKNHSRLRIYPAYIFAFFLIFTPVEELSYAALILSATGLLFRGWAAGYIQKNKKLAGKGPYGIVRHPLYLGSFLMGAGVVFFVKSWIFFIIYLIFFILLYDLAMAVEEDRLTKLFGSHYSEYCRQTPRIIPGIRSFKDMDLSGWSFSNYMRNHAYREIPGLVLLVAIIIIVQSLTQS